MSAYLQQCLILNHLGYEITASTGRPQESEYLTYLGASEIIDSIDEPLSGGRVVKAYKKLTNFIAHNQDIVDWRKSLINDAVDMFT